MKSALDKRVVKQELNEVRAELSRWKRFLEFAKHRVEYWQMQQDAIAAISLRIDVFDGEDSSLTECEDAMSAEKGA